MQRGIVYVVHGRLEQTSLANMACITQAGERYADIPQRVAYLAGEKDSLEQALDELSDCDELIFLPLLLYAATHYLNDLPQRIKAKRPQQNDVILPPLAHTRSFVEGISARVHQAYQHYQLPIVLLVHGTKHFAEPYEEQLALVEQIKQHTPVEITIADFAGFHPYKELLKTEEPVVIAPLFLTDGRLVNKAKQFVSENAPQAIWLDTLEGSDLLVDMLAEELEGVLNVSSDD